MTLDWLMGIAGFLLIVSIFANRISDRFGIPGLLLFWASACWPVPTASVKSSFPTPASATTSAPSP